MKAIVDTNVLAYALLRDEQFCDESDQFLATADELLAPVVWEAELANVLWLGVRRKLLTGEEAGVRLRRAGRMGIHSVATHRLWQGGLLRSLESGLAVYDALFVELAEREQAPLATFDSAILKAYPDLAARPGRLARLLRS